MIMQLRDADSEFVGSVPEIYERYMVPLIFEFYAADLAFRVAQRRPLRVLEIAAGTGVATRQLAGILPPEASIVATDLNQPMLDQAAATGAGRTVEWRQADAMQLPFPEAAFDAVVCQFGAMFFPDKPKAFAEARRVLRPGGYFTFNVWDRIDQNEFADAVTQALMAAFRDDPPCFMARVAHGYGNSVEIARDLMRGGFDGLPGFTTLTGRSRANSARDAALAYCQGTPLRAEIEKHGASSLGEATDIATMALERRFGSGPVEGKIQALVVEVQR